MDDKTPDTAPVATGPAWPTVVYGILCLAAAGLALTYQLTDVRIDWSVSGPLTIIGVGVVLLVAGLLALARGRTQEE